MAVLGALCQSTGEPRKGSNASHCMIAAQSDNVAFTKYRNSS